MANERRLIDREALRKAIFAEEWEQTAKMQITLDYIDMLINDQPTVDAVDVRCKDCRFAHKVDSKYEAYECGKAAYTAPWFGADEFCSRGERRCG